MSLDGAGGQSALPERQALELSKGAPKLQLSKTKALMLVNKEMGRMEKHAPVVVALAAELFVGELVRAAFAEKARCAPDGIHKLTPADIEAAISKTSHFDFLTD